MKRFIFLTMILFISVGIMKSQTNSVVLKDGTGTVISQHTNVQSAYDAIPSSVTQAYTIEILAAYTGANEVFPINFGSKTGTSAVNTISLRPAAGNTGEVISSTSTTGILNLTDADYIILDGRPGGTGNTPDLKIENLATTGTNSGTIMLLNGATNNILKYLHVVNFTQNTAGPRAIEISTSTSAGNSNNAIRYCKIEGGRSGIGLAGSTSYPNDSITISNCEIFNFGYAGIWILSAQLNTNIDSCKIYQTTGINSSIVSGIIMSTVAGGTYNIRKNWIYDLYTTSTSTSAALRGIYGSSVAAGSTVNLINNMVSNNLNNGSSGIITGFEFLGTNAYTLNMYYNTAKIGGTHSGSSTGQTSAGFRIGSSTQTLILNMKNNIAMNTRTGGNVNHCGFVMLGTGGTLNVDYNCYYSTGSNAYNVYWGGTGYNVLADYKTAVAPNEQNSVFTNVNFVSATDLHLTGSSNGDVNLKGTPVTGITIDYDNDLRHPVAPYKGADEGSILLGAKENLTAADSYHLSQNYPNPFNPVTKINFAIPKSGLVTMKIYDITGKEVATLVNDVKNAGNYIVDFNGADFSSGVYFYKLTSDDFTSVKKMMLIK